MKMIFNSALSTLLLSAVIPAVLFSKSALAEPSEEMSLSEMRKALFEQLASCEDDDDEESQSGPNDLKCSHHHEPFHMDKAAHKARNKKKNDDMYTMFQDQHFAQFGGKEAHGLEMVEIAAPENATSAYYTGVAHFQHVNNKDLYTILFSAGRHDGGSNTMMTIDISSDKKKSKKSEMSDENPFEDAQEEYIDADDVSTYTWVSVKTIEQDGGVQHLALFSGGSGGGLIGPSKLYTFVENADGTLQAPTLLWQEDPLVQPLSARFCHLEDLGDIFDSDGSQVSYKGVPDLIITGTGGLDIYSLASGDLFDSPFDWNRIRAIPITKCEEDDCKTRPTAMMGVAKLGDDDRHLAVCTRTSWKRRGMELDVPCLIFDYQADVFVDEFATRAQTVSVTAIDDGERLIVGAGGQAGRTGNPNLMFEIEKGPFKGQIAASLSPTQLVHDMPRNYTTFEDDYSYPVDSSKYFAIPAPGTTKTRQIVAFSGKKGKVDNLLEVNSGQACIIYAREKDDKPATKVLPLPGSEGFYTEEVWMYARAGDVIEAGDTMYVILAMYNGNNTVYSFDKKWLH